METSSSPVSSSTKCSLENPILGNHQSVMMHLSSTSSTDHLSTVFRNSVDSQPSNHFSNEESFSLFMAKSNETVNEDNIVENDLKQVIEIPEEKKHNLKKRFPIEANPFYSEWTIPVDKESFDFLCDELINKNDNIVYNGSDLSNESHNASVNIIYNLDENLTELILKQFRKLLLQSHDSPVSILKAFDSNELDYIYTIVHNYFNHLFSQFQKRDLFYYNVIDWKIYHFDDFCCYGTRFKTFLEQSGLFNSDEKFYFEKLYDHYYELHPTKIIDLRTKLLKMKTNFFDESLTNVYSNEVIKIEHTNFNKYFENKNEKCDISIDYKMVTFKTIDTIEVHNELAKIGNVKGKIDFLISKIQLSEESRQHTDRFICSLNKIFESTLLSELGPRFYKFGSLLSGLSTYDADLDIVIKFDSIPEDIRVDFSTSMLALEIILMVLKHKLGLTISNENTIIPSRRCPIIKLDFYWCFPELKEYVNSLSNNNLQFNKCDISVNKCYGIYNSQWLNFLVQLEPRFYQLTLILKYWAKKQNLIDSGFFSSYGWTLMIVFYLQNTVPPILPSLEQLQEKQTDINSELKFHGYRFDFCQNQSAIEKTKNVQCVSELITGFFDYYNSFDYQYAIVPRTGKTCLKDLLYREKLAQKKENKFQNMDFVYSYIMIEDPFVVDHNAGSIFRESNKWIWSEILEDVIFNDEISPQNCISILTDPKNFNNEIPTI